MLEELKKERPITEWSIKLQKLARKERYNELKKRGVIK